MITNGTDDSLDTITLDPEAKQNVLSEFLANEVIAELAGFARHEVRRAGQAPRSSA
jgi:hypothetical protein